MSPESTKIEVRSSPTGVRLTESGLERYLEEKIAAREQIAREAGEKTALTSLSALVDQAIERIEESGKEATQNVAQDAVDLALEIAGHVLRKEIARGDYDIAALVRETLAAAQTGRAACTVYVHPDEAARLEKVPFRENTNISADETVSKGSVQVQSRAGFVVRDIEGCLRNIGDRLREALA